jgi:hypothetical protein
VTTPEENKHTHRCGKVLLEEITHSGKSKKQKNRAGQAVLIPLLAVFTG